MLIDSLDVDRAQLDEDQWPCTVASIAQVVREGLTFTRPITVLIGSNGSGKSTLLEAIAEKYGLDAAGGHGGRKRANASGKSSLGRAIRLYRTKSGKPFKGAQAKGFFLRAETAFEMLSFMTGAEVAGYGERPAWQVSHGESYLQAIQGRFTGAGLYLLDEAEGPLSFESTLVLLYQLIQLSQRGDAQIIYSTHSPLVAALPGAQILELGDEGIQERSWEELEMVNLWRNFLGRPEKFFA
jgi:predicted ATPase